MASFVISDAVVIAVTGLLAKEVGLLFLKFKGRKKENGKNNFRGLLEDIRGQGKVTLDKVAGIERDQVDIKVTLKGVTTEMVNFKDKCIEQDDRLDQLDQRIFDHIKAGG
jgi:hypothetical protein